MTRILLWQSPTIWQIGLGSYNRTFWICKFLRFRGACIGAGSPPFKKTAPKLWISCRQQHLAQVRRERRISCFFAVLTSQKWRALRTSFNALFWISIEYYLPALQKKGEAEKQKEEKWKMKENRRKMKEDKKRSKKIEQGIKELEMRKNGKKCSGLI